MNLKYVYIIKLYINSIKNIYIFLFQYIIYKKPIYNILFI